MLGYRRFPVVLILSKEALRDDAEFPYQVQNLSLGNKVVEAVHDLLDARRVVPLWHSSQRGPRSSLH